MTPLPSSRNRARFLYATVHGVPPGGVRVTRPASGSTSSLTVTINSAIFCLRTIRRDVPARVSPALATGACGQSATKRTAPPGPGGTPPNQLNYPVLGRGSEAAGHPNPTK